MQPTTIEIGDVLARFVSSEELEAEWLDLLSQLEFVGCRKIVKGVRFESISLSSLRHIAEEASHAYLLKKEAERAGIPERSWTQGRFSDLGWTYFQTLDREISKLSGVSEAYPAVSWAVETRVLKVYPDYLERTRRPTVKSALGGILAQERMHGATFDIYPLPEAIKPRALSIEAALWKDLVQGLWQRSA